MNCENYKKYNVLCQTCNYPNKITCNKTFEENTKMQETDFRDDPNREKQAEYFGKK